MRVKKPIILSFLLLICVSCFATIKDEIAKTIVRVRSGNKYSTGFFWKDGSTVMTTLHSLSNVNNIEVYIPSQNDWKPAKLKKVYKNADLISLQISGYSSPKYITDRYSLRPVVDTRVFTIGYNSGSTSYIDKDFTVGLSQGNTLDDLLPASSKQEIKKLGFPGTHTEITYLKGNLLHGFSGAPIVDMQGKLVGIADGGLENGAAGISWCINADHIAILESSMESAPQLNQAKINTLFASEEYENKEIDDHFYIKLNEFRFKKIKTRTFAQLDLTGKYSSFDGLGLSQLLQNFSMVDYSSFVYDIYLEETSGATVVIPSGDILETENRMLVGGTEKIKYYLSLNRTNNIQQSSLDYEGVIMPYYYTNWTPDPVWSYPNPYPAANNSFVMRRAYSGNNNRHYLFEALVGNSRYFLGTAAKRDNFQMTQFDYSEWAKYAIAIQLTSFTN